MAWRANRPLNERWTILIDLPLHIRAGYNKAAGGKPCFIPVGTELMFKRHAMSSAMGATIVAFSFLSAALISLDA